MFYNTSSSCQDSLGSNLNGNNAVNFFNSVSAISNSKQQSQETFSFLISIPSTLRSLFFYLWLNQINSRTPHFSNLKIRSTEVLWILFLCQNKIHSTCRWLTYYFYSNHNRLESTRKIKCRKFSLRAVPLPIFSSLSSQTTHLLSEPKLPLEDMIY